MTAAPSLMGKATRGYAAYDVNARRIVFYKDFWLAVSSRIRSEIDVYRRLARHNVLYVATALAGGDI